MDAIDDLGSYRESETVRQTIESLANTPELNGIQFKLPSSHRRGADPYAGVYSDGELAGYVFNTGSEIHDRAVFGVEDSEDVNRLESPDSVAREVAPFMGYGELEGEGTRVYEVPIDEDRSFEVLAGVREDRQEETLAVAVLDGEETVSGLLAGRTGDGWSYISR
jgi:hypothetical protein